MTPILPRTEANDLHAAQVVWNVAEDVDIYLASTVELKDVVRYLKGEPLQEQAHYDAYPDKADAPALEPLPDYIEAPSPNHRGRRAQTLGIVLHSTRGGAPVGVEFDATLRWFASPASEVSAHVVIGVDGRRARCVDHPLMAWHCRSYNATHLGVELEQPHIGDPISDLQYQALQEWIDEMRAIYGDLELVEHKDTPPGDLDGKTDIGAPFDVGQIH